MRNEKWTDEQNNEATVRAYRKAVSDGALQLAKNIQWANPQINWIQVDGIIDEELKTAALNKAVDNVAYPPSQF